MLKRIERNNAAHARELGEFGRPSPCTNSADVALHYLNFSQDRLVETVNLGSSARGVVCRHGIALKQTEGDYPVEVHAAATELSSPEMKGLLP
jgi:hypothetical protein